MLENTLESPLNSKEIKPVNPKGNQPWVFIGRTDAETEAPILWPPDMKSWLTIKDPDARKDWGQEENGATEGEMLDASLTQWTPGDSKGQGSLAMLQFMGSERVRHNLAIVQTTQNTWAWLGSYPSIMQKQKIKLLMASWQQLLKPNTPGSLKVKMWVFARERTNLLTTNLFHLIILSFIIN